MKYSFLILCALLLLPTTAIFILRKDLRKVMFFVGACSIPFAFTEFLFYPTYWEPDFLFDLAKKIGFGIEDFLFVVALGTFTSTAYPFFFKKALEPKKANDPKTVAARFAAISILTATMTIAIGLSNFPMIWGCLPIMGVAATAVIIARRDLAVPSLLGATVSSLVYSIICLALALLLPGVFHVNWHGELFSNISIFKIPLEEIAYSFFAGLVATVFYPFVFGMKFAANK